MKTRLLVIWAITVMIYVTIIAEHQPAQAFPCVGGSAKEYCTGYHDGAVQAYTDYKIGLDFDIDQHRFAANSDEADFLG